MVEERKVRLHNYIAYGMGDFLGGGSFVLIGVMFLFFMTEVVGMLPTYAGLLVLLGKLWDAALDPIMGFISDRTRSRFGRRKVFFLIGILPVFLSFAALWFPVNYGSQTAMFFWYLFLFLLFSTSYTIMMVPYIALNAEMSLDYRVRARLSGFKQLGSGFSSAVCLIAAQPIVSLFPEEQVHMGYMLMGILYGLFFSLPWIAVFFGTWELPRHLSEVQHQTMGETMRKFLSVFKNKSFRLHIGMFVFGFAGLDFVMALFLYYVTYYLREPDLFPFLMVAYFTSQVVFLIIFIKLANVYGKAKAYMGGAAFLMTGLLVVYSVSPVSPSLSVLIPGVMLMGGGIVGTTTIPWVMLPSVTDVDELITGEKRAGIYSGMMTLIRKIVSAAVIFVIGVLLDLIGFSSTIGVQAPETVNYLRIIFVLGPFIAALCGMMFSFQFKITPHTHKILRDEIQRLETGGRKEDCTPEARRVCETLSGLDYHNLYP